MPGSTSTSANPMPGISFFYRHMPTHDFQRLFECREDFTRRGSVVSACGHPVYEVPLCVNQLLGRGEMSACLVEIPRCRHARIAPAVLHERRRTSSPTGSRAWRAGLGPWTRSRASSYPPLNSQCVDDLALPENILLGFCHQFARLLKATHHRPKASSSIAPQAILLRLDFSTKPQRYVAASWAMNFSASRNCADGAAEQFA